MRAPTSRLLSACLLLCLALLPAGSSAQNPHQLGGTIPDPAPTPVLPAPGLTAVDLSTLGGANSHAAAINGAGQVVGHSLTAAGEQHAFLWEDGVMYDLGTLGGAASTAIAINDSGQIIGESETRGGATHAVLWTAHHVLYLPQIRH